MRVCCYLEATACTLGLVAMDTEAVGRASQDHPSAQKEGSIYLPGAPHFGVVPP